MAGVELVPLVDEGLGNSAYLVDLGDGRALVVDVSRDLRAVHAAAARRGLTVAFAADTHLHADFLSGAHQLCAISGTRVLASAAGHREFAHTGLHDGDEVDLGGLRLRALMTPGHTHEHVSFLLLDGDGDVAEASEALPDEPTVVMRGHGERAMGAASLLERAGHHNVSVLAGGPADWQHATGREMVTGA